MAETDAQAPFCVPANVSARGSGGRDGVFILADKVDVGQILGRPVGVLGHHVVCLQDRTTVARVRMSVATDETFLILFRYLDTLPE